MFRLAFRSFSTSHRIGIVEECELEVASTQAILSRFADTEAFAKSSGV